jgi:thioredoxin-like negative regulator of GroEL
MPGKKEESLRLVLYSRPGCHLCDEMKAEIARARLGSSCALAEVDVDSDPVLAGRFGLSIPVLELEGRPLFKGRCTAAELERKVERARRERETA